jgi:hypothetical protein
MWIEPLLAGLASGEPASAAELSLEHALARRAMLEAATASVRTERVCTCPAKHTGRYPQRLVV